MCGETDLLVLSDRAGRQLEEVVRVVLPRDSDGLKDAEEHRSESVYGTRNDRWADVSDGLDLLVVVSLSLSVVVASVVGRLDGERLGERLLGEERVLLERLLGAKEVCQPKGEWRTGAARG